MRGLVFIAEASLGSATLQGIPISHGSDAGIGIYGYDDYAPFPFVESIPWRLPPWNPRPPRRIGRERRGYQVGTFGHAGRVYVR